MSWLNDDIFGNDLPPTYNESEGCDSWRSREEVDEMKKTLTTIRCVPRFGYDHADVRTVELDLIDEVDENELLYVLRAWFEARGITDAVFDVEFDDDGIFAIVNDEAYHEQWGESLL